MANQPGHTKIDFDHPGFACPASLLHHPVGVLHGDLHPGLIWSRRRRFMTQTVRRWHRPLGKKKTSMIDIRPASHALIYCFFCCLIHGVTPLWPSITIPLSYVDVLLGRKKVCDTPSQKDSFITIVIQMMGEKSCTRFGMVTQNIVICDLHHLKSSPINIDKWDLWFMNGDSYTDLMGFIIIWPFMGYPMRSSPSQTLPDCQISPSGSINFSYWR